MWQRWDGSYRRLINIILLTFYYYFTIIIIITTTTIIIIQYMYCKNLPLQLKENQQAYNFTVVFNHSDLPCPWSWWTRRRRRAQTGCQWRQQFRWWCRWHRVQGYGWWPHSPSGPQNQKMAWWCCSGHHSPAICCPSLPKAVLSFASATCWLYWSCSLLIWVAAVCLDYLNYSVHRILWQVDKLL